MVSMVKKLLEALEPLEVGQELDKKEFILLHWGYCDYFVERSFDVTFCKVKKLMPEKDFKSKNKLITRIK
jgi:hypothetical protein